MKKLYFPLLMLLLSVFYSCLNVEEHYVFQKDGACKIDYRFNMGKAVSVLSNLLPDSVKQTPAYLMQKDTAINFFSGLTEVERKKLNNDQIDLARAILLHLKMNLKNNQVLASVQYEAKSPKEVKYFLTHISNIAQQQKIGQLISDPQVVQAGSGSGGMGINEDYFNYDIGSKHFARKVDTVKFRKYFKQNEAMYNMAKAALIEMPYSVTMRFPRPIKKTGNVKAKLSADKKQLTLNSTLDEIVKTPQLLNLKVEY
ncbi:MAG: hypothetical protein ACRYFB_06310 [Janthinobacterium lividum]